MVHSSHENTEYGITELWGSTCWSLQNWTFQALKGRVRSKHFGWRSHCLDWWQIIFDSLLRNILVWRLGGVSFHPKKYRKPISLWCFLLCVEASPFAWLGQLALDFRHFHNIDWLPGFRWVKRALASWCFMALHDIIRLAAMLPLY